MKSLLLLCLLFVITDRKENSNHQANQLTKEFISTIKKSYSLEDNFVLVNKPETKEFQNCLKWILQDSLVISSRFKDFIIHTIEKPSLTSWTSELAGTPTIIHRDTINHIFTGSHPRGWDYFNKKYGKHYYIFSSPIFFNNGTMCLFYIDHHCGEMCNEGKILLYRKDNNGWKVQKEFCSWMS